MNSLMIKTKTNGYRSESEATMSSKKIHQKAEKEDAAYEAKINSRRVAKNQAKN